MVYRKQIKFVSQIGVWVLLNKQVIMCVIMPIMCLMNNSDFHPAPSRTKPLDANLVCMTP